MASRDTSLFDRLADARGNRVVFLSHCLMNENVRYLGRRVPQRGGAEMAELIRSGVGIRLRLLECDLIAEMHGLDQRLTAPSP